MPKTRSYQIDTLLFDFGGVLADEGFRNGLRAIGSKHGMDPDAFYELGSRLVFETGYVTGHADEAAYWAAVRDASGIRDSDEQLRHEILERFVLRPWMIEVVRAVRQRASRILILSDQTNWLDELDRIHHFSTEFDEVLNSYHTGVSKKDTDTFSNLVRRLRVEPGKTLFIDDNEGNVERARSVGMHAIPYSSRERFLRELKSYFPDIPLPE